MQPILIASGELIITSYSALLNLGLIAGAALTLIQMRRNAQPLAHTIDVLLAAIVGALIAARIVYVTLNGAYYSNHLNEAWEFWRGGLSWHGALVGGIIGVALIARRQTSPLTTWLDRLTPGIALGVIFGWLGCWLAACAFGREVFPGDPLFALAVDAPDAYGSWAPRLPAQLFGAMWSVVVFVAMLRMPLPIRHTGMRFAAFLTLTFAGSFAIGFSRAGNISIEQAFDALFILIGIIMLIGSFVLRRKIPL